MVSACPRAGKQLKVLTSDGEFHSARRQFDRWAEDGWICIADLQKFRNRYVEALLREEKGELSSLEEEVIASLHQQEILASNGLIHDEMLRVLSLQR